MKILFVSDIEPNLALMKIAGDKVTQGNEVSINISNPDIVYCSWAFEKHASQNILDSYKGIETYQGGFYVDPKIVLPSNIEHSMPYYPLYENGSTIPRMGYTSRGCNKNCPWCIVTQKEGRLKDNAPISEFWDKKDQRLILLDNDFINSPKFGVNSEYIIHNNLIVNFHQGLNIRSLTEQKAYYLSLMNSRLSDLKTPGAYFAWDNTKDEKQIFKGFELMENYWPLSRFNFYVLGGYPNGDEFNDLYYRCKVLTQKGLRPYIMPYNDDVHRDIKDLKRCINTGKWRSRGLDYSWKHYTRRRRKIIT